MLSRVARYLASTLLLASVVLVFGTDRDVAAQERDWVTLCDGYGAHEFDQERVAVSLQSEVLLLRAVRFCEEAVRQEPNNARLRFQLGASLVDSVSGGGLEHLEWAALRGYTAAEMMLGALALVGERPVPPGSLESETALSLALSAARKGHLDAQLLVGGLYTNAGDEDAAFPWVIKAAEQGHLGAQKAAARLSFEAGRHTDGLAWLSTAAEQDFDAGKNAAGIIVRRSLEEQVSERHPSELPLLELAAAAGFAPAQLTVATHLLGDGGDVERGVALLTAAADQGYPRAQLRLAQVHARFDGLTPDRERAGTYLCAFAAGGGAYEGRQVYRPDEVEELLAGMRELYGLDVVCDAGGRKRGQAAKAPKAAAPTVRTDATYGAALRAERAGDSEMATALHLIAARQGGLASKTAVGLDLLEDRFGEDLDLFEQGLVMLEEAAERGSPIGQWAIAVIHRGSFFNETDRAWLLLEKPTQSRYSRESLNRRINQLQSDLSHDRAVSPEAEWWTLRLLAASANAGYPDAQLRLAGIFAGREDHEQALAHACAFVAGNGVFDDATYYHHEELVPLAEAALAVGDLALDCAEPASVPQVSAAWPRDWVRLCDGFGASGVDYQRVGVGLGSDPDHLARIERFCREAILLEPENPRLRFQLGFALVGLNKVEGVSYLRSAAEKDYAAAQFVLALLWFRRFAIPHGVTSEEAVDFLFVAAVNEHPRAQYQVGVNLLKAGRRDQGLDWIRKAADQGYDKAQMRCAQEGCDKL